MTDPSIDPHFPKTWNYPLPTRWSMDDGYQLLPHLPLVSEKHREVAKLVEYERPPDEQPDEGVMYMRSRNSADQPFSKTKFCQDIQEYFQCNLVTKYSKLEPYTVYDWHRDLDRPFCVNTLIVQPAHGATTLHRRRINRMVYSIREVVYVPLQPLLFNSAIPHCVFNNSNTTRYIMSISMFGTKKVWDEAKEWFMNYRVENDSYGDEFGAP